MAEEVTPASSQVVYYTVLCDSSREDGLPTWRPVIARLWSGAEEADTKAAEYSALYGGAQVCWTIEESPGRYQSRIVGDKVLALPYRMLTRIQEEERQL